MHSEHYLITRFNVALEDSPNYGLNAEWLEHRFPLFSHFCLPSVLGQSRSDFSWIVMMDHRTPEIYRQRLTSSLRAASPKFTVLAVPPDWKNALRQYLQERMEPSATHVITSRLDNDDCIHKDFIALTREGLAEAETGIFKFTQGFTYSLRNKRLKIRESDNPFASMKERRSEHLLTVHCDRYKDLGKYAPIITTAKPAWLQIIHTHNLNNGERGKVIENAQEIMKKNFHILDPDALHMAFQK